MTNSQSVEQDGIVAGNIFAMLDNANCGVNRMTFISLATAHISCHSSKPNLETHDIVDIKYDKQNMIQSCLNYSGNLFEYIQQAYTVLFSWFVIGLWTVTRVDNASCFMSRWVNELWSDLSEVSWCCCFDAVDVWSLRTCANDRWTNHTSVIDSRPPSVCICFLAPRAGYPAWYLRVYFLLCDFI